MKKWTSSLVAILALTAMIFASCKKDDKVVTPPAQAHFLNKTGDTYFVLSPTTTYKLPIGTTDVSSSDRTVNVTITSPTGAQAGTHYTAPTTITIPAGKAVDSLEIKAVYNQYTAGRKDTLIVTINEGGSVARSDYNRTFRLLVRGACFEGDVDLNDLLGTYANTNEDWGGQTYGPYTTSVVSVTPLTATTGRIVVRNVFDYNWNDLTFTLDWTDPANRRVTLTTQNAGSNAGTSFGAAYNGQPYGVTSHPGGAGTFSVCNQTITLRMRVGIFGVGYASDLYEVQMRR